MKSWGFWNRPGRRPFRAAACEVMNGFLDDHFVVDRIQGGAGTSTNMNANEVVANRGLELMGRTKGDYSALHPIDDVNRSQSTNDTYPTAIKIALQRELTVLCAEHERLSNAFAAKAEEFASIIKVGRTQLQDAVPMTLGQEFGAFAETLREDRNRLLELYPTCGSPISAPPPSAPASPPRPATVSPLLRNSIPLPACSSSPPLTWWKPPATPGYSCWFPGS